MTRDLRNAFFGLLVTSSLAACTHEAEPAPVLAEAETDDTLGVTVDAAMQQRLGIELAPVASGSESLAGKGTAIVIDSATLTAALADIGAAREELSGARQNLARVQKLYDDDGNASRQALEAARAQFAGAQAKAKTAESRASADWGDKLISAGDTSAIQLRTALAEGRLAILRAEFPGTLPASAEQLAYSVIATGHDDSLPAQFLERSRAAAAASGGASVLLDLELPANSAIAPRPGERWTAIASTRTTATRALIPVSAAIADGGSWWFYVARKDQRFERLPLNAEQRVGGGFPAPTGIGTEDRVVIHGAPLLLSLERSAGAGASADSGDDDE
ncbi:MAG: hypothetical protein ABI769_14855 [Pseudomonadota bacterium]